MNTITYNPECHGTGKQQGDYRFALEQPGSKMLFVIGLNPSTADEKNPDPTMRKVIGFAEGNGYDGFVMFNLSAERQTDKYRMADNLDMEKHTENVEWMKKFAEKYPDADVLVAYGNDIVVKSYLRTCFRDIVKVLGDKKSRWFKIGKLTVKGNPRHPLYARYDWGFTEFDIQPFGR